MKAFFPSTAYHSVPVGPTIVTVGASTPVRHVGVIDWRYPNVQHVVVRDIPRPGPGTVTPGSFDDYIIRLSRQQFRSE